MRQLRPDVVERRKKDLLQWIIHCHIKKSKPISSALIAEESGIRLSSATIRGILQELEEEGYLSQSHASAGREPTDKGYRFYVDYLMGIQKLAASEKEKIEREYRHKVEEMDVLLAETSKLLSRVSNGTGLVFSAPVMDHVLKRLELVPLGGAGVLMILVSEDGLVRHRTMRLSFEPTEKQLGFLNRFLNERARGLSFKEAQTAILGEIRKIESEFEGLRRLAAEFFDRAAVEEPETLYIGGADHVLAHASETGDLKTVQRLIRMLTEKQALAEILEREMSRALRRSLGSAALKPRVQIGPESGVPELAGLSLITQTYSHRGRPVGVLGILGSKRMEYARMIGFMDYLSEKISSCIAEWESADDAA